MPTSTFAALVFLASCGGDLHSQAGHGHPSQGYPSQENSLDGSAPASGQSWTLVALPDTQAVVSAYPEILYAQTAWIAAQARALNIEYVVHEGDITNDSTDEQWNTADHAFRLLDYKVPYALTMGNHDYPGSGNVNSRDASQFDAHFPVSRMRWQPGLVETFEPDTVVNAAYAFQAGGQPWLIFALEFGPRDAVLAWVDRVLEARPGSTAILVTHAYLFVDGTRFDHVNGVDQYSNPHGYDHGQLDGVNDGEEMWQKLIAPHPEIRFVLCGHMHAEARLTSARPAGPPVHQMLADFQGESQGGSGFMRILTFMPDGQVMVRTYSPFLDQYRTDDENQFVLEPPPEGLH
jgi:3',5'-cyclic AMP phosphodiesterase CpdA